MAVPAPIPVTMPVDDPTEASHYGLMLQEPPVAVSVSVIVEPMQTDAGPPMAAGIGLMVTILVAEQAPIV